MEHVEATRATGRSEPQIGQVAAQQAGPRGKGTGKGDHQSDAPDKINVKREKTADQRHIKDAAPNAGHHGQNAENQAEKKQTDGPEPPGLAGGAGNRLLCSSGCDRAAQDENR